jgi:alkylation response protein AidB-like acyl-CoA dehydrogenase
MPVVYQIERGDHDLLRDLMKTAGAIGLLAADVPEVYGGLGLSIPTSALVAESLNSQQSFALTHEAHTVIATLPLLFLARMSRRGDISRDWRAASTSEASC